MSKRKIKNPGGPEKGHRGFFVFERQYICNKAKECEAEECIHNRPHIEREDGEEDFYHKKLSCTQRRLSNRNCKKIGICDKVKCMPAKGVQSKRFPRSHDYEWCVYYDGYTKECCNGVDEGTMCRGVYSLKCKGYEEDNWFFGYIELVSPPTWGLN